MKLITTHVNSTAKLNLSCKGKSFLVLIKEDECEEDLQIYVQDELVAWIDVSTGEIGYPVQPEAERWGGV